MKSHINFFLLITIMCAFVLKAQEEIEFENEIMLEDDIQLRGDENDIGFQKGSIVLSTGFLYTSSIMTKIGCEVEMGINKVLGLGLGCGYLGANCAANFHIYSKKYVDLYVSITADYLHEITSVIPEISFNFRGYSSKKKRIGAYGKIGIAMSTKDNDLELFGKTIHFKKATPMLVYSIGIPIKLKI